MADQIVQSNGEKIAKLPADYVSGATISGISRERSFVRTNLQHQNQQNKRRSLAFNQHHHMTHQQQIQQQQQLRSKPAMEIYRPPSKFQILFHF